MARKTDDLLAELADLEQLGSADKAAPASATAKKPTSKAGLKPSAAGGGDVEDENVFGDIEKQLAAKPAVPAGTSRPTTPRMSSSTTSGTNKSPKRAEHTPASSGPPSGRTSEDRLRTAATATGPPRNGGGERSYHRSANPGEERQQQDGGSAGGGGGGGGGGGWWGSVFSAATAAVKQAENLAKDFRTNEDAQRWAEQVRGYGAGLQNLSTDLRSRALPTFTNILSHIAPPISAHERLQIHTTHDIRNYPSLDPLIYSTFSRVMAQVEGGDLLVIQRGSESRGRSSSEPVGYRGSVLGGGGNGWTDGPWWRDTHAKRDLGAVAGLKEGTRLARVGAESFAREFFEGRGGVEEAAKRATETLSDSNPVRSSDIFLAIQAITYTSDGELFADPAARATSPPQPPQQTEGGAAIVEPSADGPAELVCFAIYLYDPIHSLSFSTISQPLPQQWAAWLDAAPPSPPSSSDDAPVPTSTDDDNEPALPESILAIIRAGGVDPREWVAEWTEETLGLAVAVVAQLYVARRMGVGEGAIGRGRRRVEEETLSGESARAI